MIGMLNKKVFTLGIKGLSTVWSDLANILNDPTSSKLWYRVLSDLTDEQYKKAIEHIVTTSKFKPKPADIREAALNTDDKETAEEAWIDVLEAVHADSGFNGTPDFENWITEQVVKAIGWDALLMMNHTQKPILRAQFIKIYNNYQEREKKAELAGKPELAPKAKRLHKLLSGIAKSLPGEGDD
jgi:hypothetical protein